MKPRSPIVLLAVIMFHLGGMFMLPLVAALVAAVFVEVSEVAETAPVLLAISALYIFPVFCMHAAGAVLKTRRDLRDLESAGQRSSAWSLEVLARHLSIVTPRGWSFLVVGLFFLMASLAAKWASLGTLAVLAFLLFYGTVGLSSLLSAFFVRGFSRSLASRSGSISRQMSPALVLAGEPAEERFTLAHVFIPPAYRLLIEDHLPTKLRSQSRYAIGGGATRGQVTVSGRLRQTPRGLYELGPARIWYQDFLGLTRISVAAVAVAHLKVVPRFCDLVVVRPPRSEHQSQDVVSRVHRFPTEDYFRFKEYAPGDDTRRIHWRLSVRTGRLQVRLPETREVSVDTIVLALDSFMPGTSLPHALGVEQVLDRLVETWLALGRKLVEQGERVTLVAAANQPAGGIAIEHINASRAPTSRWQDLGARISWQQRYDLPDLLSELGEGTHGVAVSARFGAPPPGLFEGQKLSWIYYPPEVALGPNDPPFWELLVGPGEGAGRRFAGAFLRLPYATGSAENGLFSQLRSINEEYIALSARRRLRAIAGRGGQNVLGALIARGDTVYRLEPGARAHRIVAMSGSAEL